MILAQRKSSQLSVPQTQLVTQRANLGANDLVNWSSAGLLDDPLNATTSVNILPNNFSAVSAGGLGLKIDIPPPSTPGVTPPFVFQTLPVPSIPTNFASGDFILFTGLQPTITPPVGNPGPLAITFDRPIFGAGAQIAVTQTPQYGAFVSAFDNNNNLIGSFSIPGNSSVNLDNSAGFLGISSDIPNISKLVFSSSEPQGAIGINDLSIVRIKKVEISAANLDSSGQYWGTNGEDEIDLTVSATLFGQRQNDKINGSESSDILHGGKGFDVLTGNGGNDILVGERGIDLLRGGGGRDTFVINAGQKGSGGVTNADIIKDYFRGEDAIKVEGVSPENILVSPITSGEYQQLTTGLSLPFFGGSKIEVISTGEILGLVENNPNLTVNELTF
ncbi:MAG: hypothetical protein SXA11_19145 [Cyanobacteriota bacterium]|nr:hypothetical protein [Cyanobacteriota bacterium]